jgi:membrane-associated protease RseP (regulator of RpoE activity)
VGLAALAVRAQEAQAPEPPRAAAGPQRVHPAPPPGVLAAPPQVTMLKAHPGEEVRRQIRIHPFEGGAWLGVKLKEVDAEKARELKLTGESGALVVEVEPDSPAAKAGIEKNDVIVEFAGERVRSAAQLRRLVQETPPGRTVAFTVTRAGQTRTLSATLAEPGERKFLFAVPAPHAMAVPPPPKPPMFPGERDSVFFIHRGARLGISADDLTPQLAEYFGVKQGKGVLVREVTVGSAAEKAGLKAGDVIVALDEQPVSTVRDVRRALAKGADEKRTVKLTIVRNRAEQTLAVELEPAQPPSRRHTADLEDFDLDLDIDVNIDEEQIRHLADQARAQAERAVEQARQIKIDRELLEQEMQRIQEQVEQMTRERIQWEEQDAVLAGGEQVI